LMIYLPNVAGPITHFVPSSESMEVLTGTETILLVDDAESVRKLVRTFLERNGYTVLEAQTSSEAAQIATKHDGPINLLLTDVVMPQVDGYQLSDYLRFHRSEMKVLYMSGYGNAVGSLRQEFRFGTPVLPKPFGKNALLLAVRQLLDGCQGQEGVILPDRAWDEISGYSKN
jgi:two-component system cell cycle sensor histidine kinase/response regulator CckA